MLVAPLLASSVAGASGSCHCQCLEALQLTTPAEGCWRAERLQTWRHDCRGGHSPILHKSLQGLGQPLQHAAAVQAPLFCTTQHWDVNARTGLAEKEGCLLEFCAGRHIYGCRNMTDDDSDSLGLPDWACKVTPGVQPRECIT